MGTVNNLDDEKLRALADRHEEIGLDLAQHCDGGSVIRAAAHFAVAERLKAILAAR